MEHFLDTPRVAIHHLAPGDEAVLQPVFEAAGDYFLSITGRPAPDPDAAEREIGSSSTTDGRHIALLSLRETGEPIGAIGWWEGNPEPDSAILGMLLIVPGRRGVGLAREALAGVEASLAASGIQRIRTGVAAGDTRIHALLGALGFSPLDSRTHVSLDRGRIMIAMFEKGLVVQESPGE
jgi:RimJ/RimL family protein N-acetyltransferase